MEYPRRTFSFFLIATLSLLLAGLAQAQEKPLVAIMDFENRTPQGGWRVGQGASDMLATAMVKTKDFRIMERDKLDAVLKEQNFTNTDRVDQSTAIQIGKILGVEYIVTGAVTEYGQNRYGGGGGGVNVNKTGYNAAVDIRVINATTGEIVFADIGEGTKSSTSVRVLGFGGGEKFNEKKASEAMRDAIDNLTGKLQGTNLAAATPPAPSGPAMIADVSGNNVMLNQGSGAGFKSGQTLEISREDRVVKDPATGKVLTVKYLTVGTIKLHNVEGSFSEGTIVSGSGFKVGDIVQ